MILNQMTENSFRLVDNTEFIMWATRETLPDLSDDTRMLILTEEEAKYIENVDQLTAVLNAILNEKSIRGHEDALQIIALPPQTASVESCTEETQERNAEIEVLMFEGLDSHLNRQNKEQFLNNVSGWIEDQTTDEGDEAFKDFLLDLYFNRGAIQF